MLVTTDSPPAPSAWLKKQTPGWWTPTLGVLSLAEALAVVAQAWLVAGIVSRVVIDQAGVSAVASSMAWLLVALTVRALIAAFRRWLAADASSHARQTIRKNLIEAIASAGPAAFAVSGRRVSVFDEQVETLDRFYTGFVPQLIAVMVIPPVLLLFVFANDWLAGMLLLLTAPVIPVFMALAGLGAEQAAARQQRQLSMLSGWFLDRVRGSVTLRLFRAEQRTEVDVQQRTDALRHATMKVLRMAFLSSAVLEFFAAVAIASVAIYVGLGLFGAIEFGPAPSLTLQSGLFVLLLAPEFFQPLRGLSQSWHDRADARASAVDIGKVLSLPPARPFAEPGFEPAPGDVTRVELRQVDFAWPAKAPLFTTLDLVIPAGQRVVLSGPSGGGKSTILGLMAGFVEPGQGQILLDGRELRRFSESARAAHIGWLGQQPWLFEGSIRENIALGRPAATSAQIVEAARRARVTDFARLLPDGLDTIVGEKGMGLSGGQAQRVALARTLISSRPLLLLDEPTASLDPAGEAEVLEALADVLFNTHATVVCASHRPGVLSWAERVIEVDQLRVREKTS